MGPAWARWFGKVRPCSRVTTTGAEAGTEAINGVIEETRRLAHGFRNFTNYRTRILLAADGSRHYKRRPRPSPQPC